MKADAPRRRLKRGEVPEPDWSEGLIAWTEFLIEDIDDENLEWCEAFHLLDRYGDKSVLLNLLREVATGISAPPSPGILWHLADLLDRHQLKRWPGKRRTPSYNRTAKEYYMYQAVRQVREAVRGGESEKSALAKYAKINGLDEKEENRLALACRGRLGSMRRVRKRQRKGTS
jgi:hypothetical protein